MTDKEKTITNVKLAVCNECNTVAGFLKGDYDMIYCTGISDHIKECDDMNLQIIRLPVEILEDLVEDVEEAKIEDPVPAVAEKKESDSDDDEQ